MLPEVFECPRCERQFVLDEPQGGCERIHCPQCGRYLGERDVAFVLRSEIEELVERLEFERHRLETDAALYGMGECASEMKLYAEEAPHAVAVLREAIEKLRKLRSRYTPEALRARAGE